MGTLIGARLSRHERRRLAKLDAKLGERVRQIVCTVDDGDAAYLAAAAAVVAAGQQFSPDGKLVFDMSSTGELTELPRRERIAALRARGFPRVAYSRTLMTAPPD